MSAQDRERLLDLLVQEATEGLSEDETRELAVLRDAFPDVREDDYALLAARVELEMIGWSESGDVEGAPALPERVRGRALRTARAPRRRRSGTWAWRVAAAASVAALALALLPLRSGDPDPASAPSAIAAREALLEAGVAALSFEATEDPSAGAASGDLVWSADAQEGYMRIAGLAANDPDVEQYQLWIFDRSRPEATPVDGGVFDIPSGARETVVPIRAKLRVADAFLFAVTVEVPGGVVVSDRARIALLAKVPQAEGSTGR